MWPFSVSHQKAVFLVVDADHVAVETFLPSLPFSFVTNNEFVEHPLVLCQ